MVSRALSFLRRIWSAISVAVMKQMSVPAAESNWAAAATPNICAASRLVTRESGMLRVYPSFLMYCNRRICVAITNMYLPKLFTVDDVAELQRFMEEFN